MFHSALTIDWYLDSGISCQHNVCTQERDNVFEGWDTHTHTCSERALLRGIRQANLCIGALRLELQFDVEEEDAGVLEVLGLLLEPSVGKRLLERNALHQERFLHQSLSLSEFSILFCVP
jgi:hypothetical protein